MDELNKNTIGQTQDTNDKDVNLQEIDRLLYSSEIHSRKLTGIQEAFYANGQPLYRRYYKDGKEEGQHYRWYNNGQLLSIRNWKEGHLDGLAEEWNKSGKLIDRMFFKESRIQWHERLHPASGLIKRSVFKDGFVISTTFVDHFTEPPIQEIKKIDLIPREERGNEPLRHGYENILEMIRANDQHPERGEINPVKNDCGIVSFERKSAVSPLRLPENSCCRIPSCKDQTMDERWDQNGDLTKRLILDHLGRPLYKNQVRWFALDNKMITALEHYQPIEVKGGWLQLGMDGKAGLFQTDPTYISDEVAELARELEPSLRRKLDQLGADPDDYIRIKRGSEIEEKPLSKGDSQEKRRSNELKI